MRHRHLAAVLAALTAVAVGVMLLVFNGDTRPQRTLAQAPASIPQLPEHNGASPIDPHAAADLDRCIAAASCTLVHTRAFSNATVEVYQEDSDPPAVHVRTVFADSTPTVWSLSNEHAATFKSMSCGLANCLLDVAVSPELVATIDMRMVSQTLQGKLEGAAVGPALQTLAADLDQDGVLDLIVTEHLVAKDGAEKLYYRTYANDERTLVSTGCTIPEVDATQPPTALQSRTCPTN